MLLYLLYSAGGTAAVYLASILLSAAMMFLLYRKVRGALTVNPLITCTFLMLFTVLTSLFFYGRPHVFSFFLLYAELEILFGFYDGKHEKTIWLVPLIAMLWSNLHGGSSCLAYLLCLLFLLSGTLRFSAGKIHFERLEKRKLIILGAVTLLSMAAVFVNPIGYRVFIYPFVNLSDKVSMTVISEWQAPDAKKIGELVLYFLPILLMVIGFIAADREIRGIDLAFFLVFLLMFFRSARFIILWYIAAAFSAFEYLPFSKLSEFKRTWEKIVAALLALALFVLAVIQIPAIAGTINDGKSVSKVMTEEAVEAVKAEAPERLFNDYNLGEALIAADIPVFFDARADLFSPDGILEDGVSLMFLESTDGEENPVRTMTEKYGFDAFLTPKSRPLAAYLYSHPELCELKYEDRETAFFVVR